MPARPRARPLAIRSPGCPRPPPTSFPPPPSLLDDPRGTAVARARCCRRRGGYRPFTATARPTPGPRPVGGCPVGSPPPHPPPPPHNFRAPHPPPRLPLLPLDRSFQANRRRAYRRPTRVYRTGAAPAPNPSAMCTQRAHPRYLVRSSPHPNAPCVEHPPGTSLRAARTPPIDAPPSAPDIQAAQDTKPTIHPTHLSPYPHPPQKTQRCAHPPGGFHPLTSRAHPALSPLLPSRQSDPPPPDPDHKPDSGPSRCPRHLRERDSSPRDHRPPPPPPLIVAPGSAVRGLRCAPAAVAAPVPSGPSGGSRARLRPPRLDDRPG
jgi:hypothetical protein